MIDKSADWEVIKSNYQLIHYEQVFIVVLHSAFFRYQWLFRFDKKIYSLLYDIWEEASWGGDEETDMIYNFRM